MYKIKQNGRTKWVSTLWANIPEVVVDGVFISLLIGLFIVLVRVVGGLN